MRRLATKLFSLALLATGPAAVKAADGPTPTDSKTAYDFNFNSIDGKPMPLADYRGKALLIVNTASFCGFTPQYRALQALHEKYQSQGFAVIGVPSNDFGGQEPGSAGQIKEFCEVEFGINFPLTEKAVVVGSAAHPFYAWAAATLGAESAPRWNFHKYLVGRDGRLVQSFYSGAVPDSKDVTSAVEAALAKSPPT
ncbi:MAG: glutathione peroxidase [Hyphomicrobium sp.]|nr:glutathione peroxidase [Hyphomicrobium sp.]